MQQQMQQQQQQQQAQQTQQAAVQEAQIQAGEPMDLAFRLLKTSIIDYSGSWLCGTCGTLQMSSSGVCRTCGAPRLDARS